LAEDGGRGWAVAGVERWAGRMWRRRRRRRRRRMRRRRRRCEDRPRQPPVHDKLTVPATVEVATGVPKAVIATNVVILPKVIERVVV